MNVATPTIVLRLLCGLSVLILSAAQQKAFALSPVAPAGVSDDQQPGPTGKKKHPLTLQQTLPDVIGARGAGALLQPESMRDDGRFPPLDPNDARLALAASFITAGDGMPDFRCPRPFATRVASDLPALRAFEVCLPRTGPPAA